MGENIPPPVEAPPPLPAPALGLPRPLDALRRKSREDPGLAGLRNEPPRLLRDRVSPPDLFASAIDVPFPCKFGRISVEMSWITSFVPVFVFPRNERPGLLSASPLMRPSPDLNRSAYTPV